MDELTHFRVTPDGKDDDHSNDAQKIEFFWMGSSVECGEGKREKTWPKKEKVEKKREAARTLLMGKDKSDQKP